MKRSILYVGLAGGTSGHRAEALRSLGQEVVHVSADLPRDFLRLQLYRLGNRLRRNPDLVGANRRARAALATRHFDLLWVDKGLTISPATLRFAKARHPGLQAVSYSPDDMFAPDLQSARYLACVSLFDLHVTTKSFNVEELPRLGARDVFFVDNAFDPATHRPLELTREERVRYGTDVGFVGTWEPDRAATMLQLVRDGVPVRIWGHGWSRLRGRHPSLDVRPEQLPPLEYAKAINATGISLGFLRKAYRDRQTTRSIEIPACGAFLLAERTDEHLRLFREGEEAEFFGSYEELLAKCRHYLAHPEERTRIGAGGRRRCLQDGYDNASRLSRVLAYLEERGC